MFVSYQIYDITGEMSFLEMLDRLNDRLIEEGIGPVAFDSDFREGSARPIRMPARCCSSALRSPTWVSSHKVNRSDDRAVGMVNQQDVEGFGGCSNTGECASAWPKHIPLDVIAQLNRDFLRSHS